MSDCLLCKNTGQILSYLPEEEGTPHFDENHNFQHGTIKLEACEICTHGVIIKCDHDCFSHYTDEPWDMYWYAGLNSKSLETIQNYLKPCQTPREQLCDCPLHQHVRQQLETMDGSWGREGYDKDPNELTWFQVDLTDGSLLFQSIHKKGD